MEIKLAKTKREKNLLYILTAIIIVAVYFSIFLRPIIRNLGGILPKASFLKTELSEGKFLIERKDIIEEKRRTFQLDMERYGKVFPSQHEIPRLLENLSGIAGESDVKIVGIRPLSKEGLSPDQPKEIYQEIPIEIIAESGYHQLGQFLQELEGGDRFIMIKDIKIMANPQNVQRHNIRLIASTYILIKE